MCMQSDSLSNLRMKLSGATVFNCCLWASLLDDRIAFSDENQLVSILIHQDKRRQQHREREWNLEVHTKVSNFRINWFLLFRSITFSLHKAAAAVALHLTNVKRWEKFVRARWANWGQNVGQPSDAICSWLSRQIVWEICNTNNQNWLRLKSEIRSPATQLRDWDPIRSLKVEQTSRIFFHYQIAIRFCNFLLLHWRLEKSNAIHNYPSISMKAHLLSVSRFEIALPPQSLIDHRAGDRRTERENDNWWDGIKFNDHIKLHQFVVHLDSIIQFSSINNHRKFRIFHYLNVGFCALSCITFISELRPVWPKFFASPTVARV